MDGRDIGSNVLTDAQIKVYLDADVEERAQRRCHELAEKGIAADRAKIEEEIEQRDKNDKNRECNPLTVAPDAVIIDTTAMSIDEVSDAIGSPVSYTHLEIVMNIRSLGNAYRLVLSANPSHPRLFFTSKQHANPQNPPLFCMVLRKHLQSGKIVDVTQPSLERIVNIYVESMNEMGDYSVKKLVLEIMGRHSNLILVDEGDRVLDCVKHITHDKSSVREVLPGKEYELPPSQHKRNIRDLSYDDFYALAEENRDRKLQQLVYTGYTGCLLYTSRCV